jgi:hypothetical protein
VQNRHVTVRVGIEGPEGIRQRPRGGAVHGIAHLGSREAHYGNAIPHFYADCIHDSVPALAAWLPCSVAQHRDGAYLRPNPQLDARMARPYDRLELPHNTHEKQ